MRIERHRVDEAGIASTREDFADRIGSQVRSLSKAGPMTSDEWWLLSQEFLDYLGALSVESPDLDIPEAKAVLQDAAEAAAGAVAYAAYFPHESFHVFLDYVNFGMSYDPGSEGDEQSVTAARWLDAFCLAVLTGRASWHGEAFHFARPAPSGRARAGHPAVELVNGLMAYVLGDTGDEDQDGPASAAERLTALDAALARVTTRAGAPGESGAGDPHGTALHALRALSAGDREAFRADLADLLRPHSAQPGPVARPRSLLPLLPLALAALAYRCEGWQPPVDTGYLPRALVTGFETAGPRVQEYGRDRRADAVAELAAGTVALERPDNPRPLHPESEVLFERYTREAFTPRPGEPPAVRRLSIALRYQAILFATRASHVADATDRQLAGLRLASQVGAALFRIALAEPGTDVDVMIDGRTLTLPAQHGDHTGPAHWHTAANFALITGSREDLAPIVLAGPARHGRDGSAFAAYRHALHDYLRGADPEPATDRAVRDCQKVTTVAPPPAVLFSQLVEGDEESFNLALLDALEAHRDHYRVADRTDDCEAAVNLDILALACHARRRGWHIRVASPYLPPRLLLAAEPF